MSLVRFIELLGIKLTSCQWTCLKAVESGKRPRLHPYRSPPRETTQEELEDALDAASGRKPRPRPKLVMRRG